jgi:hypothetical protein
MPGKRAMNGSHTLVQIRHDLVAALAYQLSHRGRASSDALVPAGCTANDAEVEQPVPNSELGWLHRTASQLATPESGPAAAHGWLLGKGGQGDNS